MTAVSSMCLIAVGGVDVVAAAEGFGCERTWSSPSSSNSIVSCGMGLLSTDYLLSGTRGLTLLVALICLVGTFLCQCLCTPLVCLCRYMCGCCGGSRRRPNAMCRGDARWDKLPGHLVNRGYNWRGVLCAKASVAIMTALGIMGAGAVLIGAQGLVSAYDTGLDNAMSMCMWVTGRIMDLEEAMSVPMIVVGSAPGPQVGSGALVLPPPFTSRLFNDTVETVRRACESGISSFGVGQQYFYILRLSALVLFLLASAPLLPLFIGLCSAACNIQTCGPSCAAFWQCTVSVLYGLIAAVLLILSVPVADLEGERKLFVDASSTGGIVRMLLLPLVNSGGVGRQLESSKNATLDLEAQAIALGCDMLWSSCSDDPNPTTTTSTMGNNSQQQRPLFRCNAASSSATQPGRSHPACQDAAAVTALTAQLTLRSDAGVQCVSSSGAPAACSLVDCAVWCNDTAARQTAAALAMQSRFVTAISKALHEKIVPYWSLEAILRVILTQATVLDSLSTALTTLASGMTGLSWVLMIAVWLMFRGQKRFFAISKEHLLDAEPVHIDQVAIPVIEDSKAD